MGEKRKRREQKEDRTEKRGKNREEGSGRMKRNIEFLKLLLELWGVLLHQALQDEVVLRQQRKSRQKHSLK